jgi:nucleotide-binding universal stress UspA family protein
MRAVVWIEESTWEACIAEARDLLPPDADVTLVHVAPIDVEELAGGGGLLGRHPAPPPSRAVREVADNEARALPRSAVERFARPARVQPRRGPVERELLRACANADLLLVARDGELRLGPKSLGRRTRFIVDHAPCAVLLAWPASAPSIDTIRLPPHLRG